MFGIATDASGQTCDAEELVRGHSPAQIGNARKREYFCVACAGARHPVSLYTYTYTYIYVYIHEYT